MPTDLHSIINRSLVVVVVTQRKKQAPADWGMARETYLGWCVNGGASPSHITERGWEAALALGFFYFILFFCFAAAHRQNKKGPKRKEQNGPTTKLFRPRPLIGFPGKFVRQKIIFFFLFSTSRLDRTNKKGNKNEIDPAHPTRM
jgi:hypothetical protein